MKTRGSTLCLFLSFCGAFAIFSMSQVNVPRIGIEDLKRMIDHGTEVTIIDTQPLDVYEMEHIKGAISLPWKRKLTQQDLPQLPKNRLIVTYCDCGPGESDSADVAAQLLKMGFNDVRVLQDPSIRGWRNAGYPIEKK
jgi:rhodanese-related sulfurtransferase